MERYTIRQFNRDFPDSDACLDYIVATLYPEWADGRIRCRKCAVETKHHRISKRKAYVCQHCGTHVYPLAGTVFEKSSTPLDSWFYAMFLMAQTRSGISAKQLERELGVTYKTAWRMFKQIRGLMAEDAGPLRGTVEVDETLVGGKPRYRQSRKGPRSPDDPTAKKPVLGMVERGGRVKALVTADVRARTLQPYITAHIAPESQIMTDDARQYARLRGRGFGHKVINHSARVYVDGDVHTNTIEGFWSVLKNGIRGVYHQVGKDYLQTYVNEYTFRYNHRDDVRPMFRTILKRAREVRQGRYGVYSPIAR